MRPVLYVSVCACVCVYIYICVCTVYIYKCVYVVGIKMDGNGNGGENVRSIATVKELEKKCKKATNGLFCLLHRLGSQRYAIHTVLVHSRYRILQ